MRRLVALNRTAQAAGLRPGMTVAAALAVHPGLTLAPADPAGERALVERLVEWCGHYTPWAAVSEPVEGVAGGGLWLDISGCAHLFGGEEGLLGHLLERLERLGFAARAAAADTPGAAWAWARFGAGMRERLAGLSPGGQRDALASLPVAALRLGPAIAAGLAGLGLKRVGDLYAMPASALGPRFGREVLLRLDQALGLVAEPISPRRPPAPHRRHLAFAEPIARPEDVAEAVRRQLMLLCRRLEQERLGVRRLEVAVFRVDGSWRELAIGTGRANRDPTHLMRLLAEPLSTLDAGFGIEMMRLSASELAPLAIEQGDWDSGAVKAEEADLPRLLDGLGNRLGFRRVVRFAPQPSHQPEEAVRRLPAGAAPPAAVSWPAGRRPLRLFARPEPVEVVAPVPDAPPVMFRWRAHTHRVVRADGAERIAGEWWRRDAPARDHPERDYYMVEDERGGRFWLFRLGLYGAAPPPRWFIHGVFP